MQRTWKCPDCGNTAQFSYEDIVEVGTPFCDRCPARDRIEMELCDVAPGDLPRVRMIVSMHGGLVECVLVDSDQVNVSDVVFTERPQEATLDDETFVVGGELDGEMIYTHHGVSLGDSATFDAVFKAAEARIAQAGGGDE